MNEPATSSQNSAETVRFTEYGRLLEFLAEATAKGHAVLPSTSWSLPAQAAGRIKYRVDISPLKRVIEHTKSDQVITVDAGISIGELQNLLAQSGHWFPTEVPPTWLLADVINTGRSGALEHGFGGPRDLVLGLTCALASGRSIKCGGKVVKNVTGYDLTRLFTGAYATLCLPVCASLRLYAVPERRATAFFAFTNITEAWNAAARLRSSGLPFSAMEILDKNLLAQITAQLENALPADSAAHFQLCLEASGSSSLVEEIWKTTREICGQPLRIIENEAERGFWLAAGFADEHLGLHKVEFASTGKQLLEIEKMLPPSEVAFSARPGRNRLYAWAKSRSDATEIVNSVTARSTARNMTVAFSSDQLIWDVRRAAPDEAQQSLKQRLKNEFDPAHILNPLVSL